MPQISATSYDKEHNNTTRLEKTTFFNDIFFNIFDKSNQDILERFF